MSEEFSRITAKSLDVHCECGQLLVIPVDAHSLTCQCGRSYARLNGRLGINQFTQTGPPFPMPKELDNTD